MNMVYCMVDNLTTHFFFSFVPPLISIYCIQELVFFFQVELNFMIYFIYLLLYYLDIMTWE